MSWSEADGGVGVTSHAQYLTSVGETFEAAAVRLIDDAVRHRNKLAQNPLFIETLQVRVTTVSKICALMRSLRSVRKLHYFAVLCSQHLKMAHDRCRIFHGRDDLLDKLQTILSRDSRQPIVVHGHSGCGKTSLMAMTAQKVGVLIRLET